jgi:GNAT superfamily N-acetyltransferase
MMGATTEDAAMTADCLARMTAPAAPRIRRAGIADLPALREMHARSLRELAHSHYPANVIDSFLEHVGTVDATMIDDGYFLAQIGGEVVASGGWSEREPAYLRAVCGAARGPATWARIRGVFVHPAHARRGLGRAIVRRAEHEARAQGHAVIALDATLAGVPLYAPLGYRSIAAVQARLPDGEVLELVHMRKRFAPR